MAPVAKAHYIRDANLKALYGISLPQYEELLRTQGGVCGSARVRLVESGHWMLTMRAVRCAACYAVTAIEPSLYWTRIRNYLIERKNT
jgi:hypothetical protein